MTDFFGYDWGEARALIGPITLIVCGAMFFGGAMLRKALNDYFDIKFSLIGCTGIGSLAYIIANNLLPIKWALLIGIGGWIVGGFILSFISGESSDEYEMGGNYEE